MSKIIKRKTSANYDNENIDKETLPKDGNRGIAKGGHLPEYTRIDMMLREDWEGPTTMHNLPFEGRELLKAASRATASDDTDNSQYEKESFPVTYWYVHLISLSDKGQGPQAALRVVLMDDDFNCANFVSNGVVQSLLQLFDLVGPGPYDPPIPARMQVTKTAAGYQHKRLVFE